MMGSAAPGDKIAWRSKLSERERLPPDQPAPRSDQPPATRKAAAGAEIIGADDPAGADRMPQLPTRSPIAQRPAADRERTEAERAADPNELKPNVDNATAAPRRSMRSKRPGANGQPRRQE